VILAVDLAAKFSAAVHMDVAGEVVGEWHSWQRSQWEWAQLLGFAALGEMPGQYDIPNIVLIEDVPLGLRQSQAVKGAFRAQGRILQTAVDEAKIVWIPPKLWQDYYKPYGMSPGDKKAAKSIAFEQYGYSAPELLRKDLHGVDRVHARKTMEDHTDAFLIARYMLEQTRLYGSIEAAVEAIPRLERYSSGS
jgi:hypothetical protein